MFNFFKSGKEKKLEAIGEQILLWHKACIISMTGAEKDLLKEPRPQVGAVLYFLGSIDNLCQANKIDDQTFGEFAIKLLDIMGFQKKFTIPIVANFYTQRTDNKFALKANIEGGKKLTDFLSGENLMAPLAFGAFVREWADHPDLGPEDVSLFVV
jgi:hypothetical protein